MKKSLFVAAIAALALVACNKTENVETANATDSAAAVVDSAATVVDSAAAVVDSAATATTDAAAKVEGAATEATKEEATK
ncbi:hypothetical protein [Kaistella sp.]|uniref:hypothetical protein n=1 Tax=Kaistella sp. TaxID=2782235 RepID=UPI003C3BB4AF